MINHFSQNLKIYLRNPDPSRAYEFRSPPPLPNQTQTQLPNHSWHQQCSHEPPLPHQQAHAQAMAHQKTLSQILSPHPPLLPPLPPLLLLPHPNFALSHLTIQQNLKFPVPPMHFLSSANPRGKVPLVRAPQWVQQPALRVQECDLDGRDSQPHLDCPSGSGSPRRCSRELPEV